MSCKKCERFPAPTSNFQIVGEAEKRHGILYQCKKCGQFIEVVAEERAPHYISHSDAKKSYDV